MMQPDQSKRPGGALDRVLPHIFEPDGAALILAFEATFDFVFRYYFLSKYLCNKLYAYCIIEFGAL